MNFHRMMKSVSRFINKNSTKILTITSACGVVSTAALSGEARLQLDKLLKQLRAKYNGNIPKSELTKAVLSVYAPTAISGGLTIASIICTYKIEARRHAVIASLYSASEAALREYQNKVGEIVGEKKALQIRDEIVNDKIEANPPNDKEVIITGIGETLCYDLYSDRYFKSDIENIRKIENDVNKRILSEMWVTLNEVYFDLGLKRVKYGDQIGFNVDNMLHFHFSSHISPNGQPCLTIGFEGGPMPYR